MSAQFAGLMAMYTVMTAAADGQITVKNETLPVYSKADTTSTVVRTLKKADAVVIEFSISGEDGIEWCSIRQPSQDTAGFVRCAALNRPPAPKPVPTPATAPLQSTGPGIGQQARSRRFWEPGHRDTLGEYRYLSYARRLATTFEFSQEQKDQALRIADRIGLLACIEETDNYARKGLTPPDLLWTPRSRTTKCDWVFQTFMEQTFALVTSEQKVAHRAAYMHFTEEIANHRRAVQSNPR